MLILENYKLLNYDIFMLFIWIKSIHTNQIKYLYGRILSIYILLVAS